MALKERLATLTEAKKNNGIVARWLETLSPEDQALADEYLRNPEIPTRGLHLAFQAEGAPFGKDSLAAYRHGLKKA
jgi:hypothetical protein